MITQKELIKRLLPEITGKLNINFKYSDGFIFKEDSLNIFYVSIESSNLDKIYLGTPRIVNKSTIDTLTPIFNEFEINFDKWNLFFQIPLSADKQCGPLKTETAEDVELSIIQLTKYFSNTLTPLWHEFENPTRVNNVIETFSELELNQGIFQGLKGILVRFVYAHQFNSPYFDNQKMNYQKILDEHAAKEPEEYEAYAAAFSRLINNLEST